MAAKRKNGGGKKKSPAAAYKSKVGLKALLIILLVIVIIAILAFAAYKAGLIPQKYVDYIKYEILKIDKNDKGDNGGKKNETSDIIETDSYASEELEIYFPELQSYYTGDCTLIKVGNVEVLIDAGSKTSCVATVDDFIKTKCTDGKLEYVIVTHAHEDHYAGFATSSNVKSIFDRYEIGTIIDFAQITEKKDTQNMYKNYQRELSEAVTAGATHYTAKEVRESGNYIFSLSETVSFTIIDSYYYYNVSKTENDHSVCTLLTQTCADGKERNFLFTGDLEKKGESWIAANDNLPEVELFKAGHHGSKTSSNSDLLAVIKPKIVCVCCCAGTSEYTKTQENQFPTQEFINRISFWTARVYVTTVVVDDKAKTFESMNGTITVISFENKITINGSNNNTVLKDTEWFKNNRTCPENWAS